MTALEEQPVAPTIPHSITAEEAVMGAILINPDAYYEIAHILRAEDFYIHRLKWIFEACAHLQEKHIPLDLVTLTEALDRKGQLAEIGEPRISHHSSARPPVRSMPKRMPRSLPPTPHGDG